MGPKSHRLFKINECITHKIQFYAQPKLLFIYFCLIIPQTNYEKELGKAKSEGGEKQKREGSGADNNRNILKLTDVGALGGTEKQP